MSQSKPKVILTRKLPETIETRMRELFDTTLNDSDKALSRDELEIAVKTADVLVHKNISRFHSNFQLVAA